MLILGRVLGLLLELTAVQILNNSSNGSLSVRGWNVLNNESDVEKRERHPTRETCVTHLA